MAMSTLVIAKVVYCLYFLSLGCLVPFISLFLNNLGMTHTEIGIVSGLRPLMFTISPIVFGVIVDRTKKTKAVLIIITSLSLCIQTSGLFVKLAHDRSQLRTVNGSTAAANGTCVGRALAVDTTSNLSLVISNTSVDYVENCNFVPSGVALNGSESESSHEDSGMHSSTFWMTLIIFTVGSFFDGSVNPMIDSIIMHLMSKMSGVDFGRQRAFGTLGFGLACIYTGLVQYYSPWPLLNDHMMFLSFFLVGACMVVVIVVSFKNICPDNEKPHFIAGLRMIVRSTEMVMLLLCMLVLGFSNGVIGVYFALLMNNLGAGTLLIGGSYAVACLSEMVVMSFAATVSRLIRGLRGAMILALAVNGLRTLFLTYIQHPYLGLLFMALHCFVFGTLWPAAVEFLISIAPPSMLNTFTGILYCAHFGIAVCISTVAGGALAERYGLRWMFRTIAFITLAWLAVYILYVSVSMLQDRRKRRARFPPEVDVPDELQNLTAV